MAGRGRAAIPTQTPRLRLGAGLHCSPKNAVFAQAGKRSLPASGTGKPGEKAATAIADFLVVDMFANDCTGREDARGAIAIAERQLKRIYR